VPLGQRFGIGYVQAGAGDRTRFQSRHQVVGHRRGAASDADVIGRGLHRVEHRLVEHAPGISGQRQGVDDHVGTRGELVQFIGQADVFDVIRSLAAAVTDRKDVHAQAVAAHRHLGADAAQADHQHGAARELDEIGPLELRLPLPLTFQLVGVVDIETARQHHHQRDRVFGQGRRADLLRIGE